MSREEYSTPLSRFTFLNMFSRVYLNTDRLQNWDIALQRFYINPWEQVKGSPKLCVTCLDVINAYMPEHPECAKETEWQVISKLYPTYIASKDMKGLQFYCEKAFQLVHDKMDIVLLLLKEYGYWLQEDKKRIDNLPYNPEPAWRDLVQDGFLSPDRLPLMYVFVGRNLNDGKPNGYSIHFVTDVFYLTDVFGARENHTLLVYREYFDTPFLTARLIDMDKFGNKSTQLFYLVPFEKLTASLEYKEVNDLFEEMGKDEILSTAEEIVEELNTNTLH